MQRLLLKRQRELEEAQAFNAWLGERRPGGAAAPGRREPADGGSAPPGPSAALRACRAQGRRTRSGRSCRAVTLKEMKTLWAHGFSQRPRFEQVVGYLERNEPLPLDQPDRKATTFVTSHFYLDDFVQSSEDPNPQPLQHTPLRAIPEEGFRTPAEATDEDLDAPRRRKPLWRGRPRRRLRGRRADEQRTGPALHHGPSAQRGRRSAGSSGRGRRSSRARGGAGLPQLPQDAAEYVRLHVLPRPGQQPQPLPQIIGRLDDVERLLDEAASAQAIQETTAVAAEEGAVAAGGVFGNWGAWQKEQQPSHTVGEVAGAATAGVGAAATAGLAVGLAGGAA